MPFLRPVLLVWALVFVGVFYFVNLQASLYDITNPRWVVTMACLILLSPLFNGVFILLVHARQERQALSLGGAAAKTFTAYVPLVMGEVVVNLIVVAGGLFFVLPGIYLGLRLIFYKQEMLIGGERHTMNALRKSLARTTDWRRILSLLGALSLFYSPTVVVFFLPVSLFWDLVAVLLSAFVFAWTNVFLTLMYQAKEASAAE